MECRAHSIVLAAIVVAIVAFAGCSSKNPDPASDRFYGPATRQVAPDPVYNPIRSVRPPQVTPTRQVKSAAGPVIEPVIHLTLQQTPICEAIQVLTAATRYRLYCSSLVAKQVVSIDALGTLGELASKIENQSKVVVVIDHENEEVRVLGSNREAH